MVRKNVVPFLFSTKRGRKNKKKKKWKGHFTGVRNINCGNLRKGFLILSLAGVSGKGKGKEEKEKQKRKHRHVSHLPLCALQGKRGVAVGFLRGGGVQGSILKRIYDPSQKRPYLREERGEYLARRLEREKKSLGGGS